MDPPPKAEAKNYRGSGKLDGKVAIITGGDSGIGRSVAIHFAKEGADVVICYHSHDEDAEETKKLIEKEGKKCIALKGDIRDEKFCQKIVQKTADAFGGRINVLVNNAGYQLEQEKLEDISSEQLHRTFETNIYSMFYVTKAALKYMQKGDCIINTTSITSYRGNLKLIDYSSTKGAITSFTRSLSLNLQERGIRVNAVAPGPVWTPLIPVSFSEEHVKNFGKQTHLKRALEPDEVAPSYVFLANDGDSIGFTGQVFHPNGGAVINT